jgi:L,D-transpeptidase YcbB
MGIVFKIAWILLPVLACGQNADPRLSLAGTKDIHSQDSHRAGRLRTEETRDELRSLILEHLAGTSPDVLETELQHFYAGADFSLAWLRNSKPTTQALALIQILQNAARQGLLSEDYEDPEWTSRLALLERSGLLAAPPEQARFDRALTLSAMRYVSDLYWGRVSRGRLLYRLRAEKTDFGVAEFLRRHVVDSLDVELSLQELQPPFPTYGRTIQALETYSQLALQGDIALPPLPSRVLRRGDFYEGIPSLVLLLQRLGDLSSEAVRGANEYLYSGELIGAVQRFQERHGLDTDGVIGPRTLNALNTPIRKRILQLHLALERWRWLPREFAREPILINLPEFNLHAYDRDFEPTLSMKIVIGKALRHRTPLFAGEMDAVIFHPFWNVPWSIQRKELVPAIAKNRNYVRDGNYEIVDRRGSVLSNGEVNDELLLALRSGKAALRQRPGVNNSLGLIKFSIPNEYDVYVHATPAMSLFSHARRDFSHGCMRVQDAETLARWVLQNETGWSAAQIRRVMDARKTLRANLDQPVPVMVVYITAVVQPDGRVRFFEDIYGEDAGLAGAISQRPLPYNE